MGKRMSWSLMDERRLKYISPVDREFRWLSHLDDIIVLPLKWPEVNAFYCLEKFVTKRLAYGRQRAVMTSVYAKEDLIHR